MESPFFCILAELKRWREELHNNWLLSGRREVCAKATLNWNEQVNRTLKDLNTLFVLFSDLNKSHWIFLIHPSLILYRQVKYYIAIDWGVPSLKTLFCLKCFSTVVFC